MVVRGVDGDGLRGGGGGGDDQLLLCGTAMRPAHQCDEGRQNADCGAPQAADHETDTATHTLHYTQVCTELAAHARYHWPQLQGRERV